MAINSSHVLTILLSQATRRHDTNRPWLPLTVLSHPFGKVYLVR